MTQRLRDHCTFASLLLYLLWRAVGSWFPLRLQLRNGIRLSLRPLPYHDLFVAKEVFALDLYALPPFVVPGAIHRVVDLGANVGLTCLHWAHLFPDAQVIVLEPHPAHVKQIRSHLALNQCADRVELLAVAAGTCSGQALLSDRGAASSLFVEAGANCVSVQVVDWFEMMAGVTIDLLKMDIEGSEYPLLADSRFERLDVKALVVEWHVTAEHPASEGRDWCLERLHQLGYQTQITCDEVDHGIIWAFRGDPCETAWHAGEGISVLGSPEG